MGLSAPSAGKACGASPLTLACARHCRWLSSSYWGSAPPHRALARRASPLKPRLRSSSPMAQQQLMGLSTQLMGLSAPSAGKACGASPLTLASLALPLAQQQLMGFGAPSPLAPRLRSGVPFSFLKGSLFSEIGQVAFGALHFLQIDVLETSPDEDLD